ncbi:MAG: DNA-binding response regulator [Spirochaetaceae bacterium]|nr:MAG: DNA-binding response regulator [Spirochaetaceae bacterium]
MIKVIIADDHSIIRRGIRDILDESGIIKVADEAQDGKELIGKMMGRKYDVVVLDINMPGNNGLVVLKDIKKLNPSQIVLMLSMYPEEEYAIRAIKSGAAGYLRKDSNPNEIISAIKTVYSGKKYLSSDLHDRLIDELREPSVQSLHGKLSNRELEIFIKIGNGRTLSEISEEMALSPKTVSTYRARIMEKTKMRNNAEIMKYVIENKID